MAAELFRGDGHAERHVQGIVAFPHFAKAPTNVQCRNRPCFLFTCSPDSHRITQDTLRFRQHQIGIVVSRRYLAAGSPPIKLVVRVQKSSSQTGLFGLLRCYYFRKIKLCRFYHLWHFFRGVTSLKKKLYTTRLHYRY